MPLEGFNLLQWVLRAFQDSPGGLLVGLSVVMAGLVIACLVVGFGADPVGFGMVIGAAGLAGSTYFAFTGAMVRVFGDFPGAQGVSDAAPRAIPVLAAVTLVGVAIHGLRVGGMMLGQSLGARVAGAGLVLLSVAMAYTGVQVYRGGQSHVAVPAPGPDAVGDDAPDRVAPVRRRR